MVAQVEKMIPIFAQMHPNCVGVFCFDQSSNHAAMAEDALVASRMNFKSGGQAPKMKDGWFFDGDIKVVQKMQDAEGVPKGLKAILEERKL